MVFDPSVNLFMDTVTGAYVYFTRDELVEIFRSRMVYFG